jgi:hypothetical protein
VKRRCTTWHLTVHSGTLVLSSIDPSAGCRCEGFNRAVGLIPVRFVRRLPDGLHAPFRRGTSASLRLLAVLVIYGVLAHPFLMRVCEIRYLIPTYPLMLLAAVLVVAQLRERIKKPSS